MSVERALNKTPRVGDELRYVGDSLEYMTHGAVYEVKGFDEEGDPYTYDNAGDREYITPNQYGNYRIAEDIDDPGAIYVVDESLPSNFDENPVDRVFTIEVQVNAEGLKTIRGLAAKHLRVKKREVILRQIEELEQELKKL